MHGTAGFGEKNMGKWFVGKKKHFVIPVKVFKLSCDSLYYSQRKLHIFYMTEFDSYQTSSGLWSNGQNLCGHSHMVMSPACLKTYSVEQQGEVIHIIKGSRHPLSAVM